MNVDPTSLDWVHDQFAESLARARHMLEGCADNSDEVQRMGECAEVLHELGGVAHMIEFHGGALLTGEMEAVAHELVQARIADRDEARHLLTRAFAELTDYIAHVHAGHRDNPIVLMPMLNDLRGVRGAELFSGGLLFSPDLLAPLPAVSRSGNRPDDATLRTEVAKLRPFLQKGLAGWFRDAPPAEGIGLVAAVVFRMFRLLGASEARRLWWVASGVASALRNDELEVGPALKGLMTQLVPELEVLAHEGESRLEASPPRELLKNLLYYVALAASGKGPNPAIREAFQLDQLLRDAGKRLDTIGAFEDTSPETYRKVGEELRDDLARVQDSFNAFERNDAWTGDELTALAESLLRIADTLGLLNLGQARHTLLEQADAIQRLRDQHPPPAPEALMEVAAALLSVDRTLEHLVVHAVAPASDDPGVGAETERQVLGAGLTDVEYRQLMCAVFSECEVELRSAEGAIAAFVADPDDYDALTGMPEWLRRVAGGLRIVSLERAADTLERWRRFVQIAFVEQLTIPAPDVLDACADALVNFESYLQAMRVSHSEGERFLEGAEGAVRALEARYPDAVDPEASAEPEGNALEEEPDWARTRTNPEIPEGLLEDLQRASDLLERLDEDYVAPHSRPPLGSDPGAASALGASDAVTVEVFLAEVEQVRAGLVDCLPSWKAEFENSDLLDTVRRYFHMLKGSGRLIGAEAIAGFASTMEDLLNRVISKLVTPDRRIVDLVEDATTRLPELVHAFTSSADIPQDVRAILERAEALGRARVSDGLETETDPGSHPEQSFPEEVRAGLPDRTVVTDAERSELRRLFLEEAVELLESMDASMIQWQAQPTQLELAASIHREIHTLKGGARLANLGPIGDVAHALESVLMLVGQRDVPVSDRLFELLQQVHDRLGTALDHVRANEPLLGLHDLSNELDRFIAPYLSGNTERSALADSQTIGQPANADVDLAGEGELRRDRVSVHSELLSEIESQAGEISITHGQIARFVSQLRENLSEMERTVERLREQIMGLDLEADLQIVSSDRGGGLGKTATATDGSDKSFTPLERDRLSTFQALAHGLTESAGDLSGIQTWLAELARDSEELLAQQAMAAGELRMGLMQTRMLAVSRQTPRLRRIVRETARELGKYADLTVEGDEIQIDRAVFSRMQAPLEHMLRNAVDHGIEEPGARSREGKGEVGHISLSFNRDGHEVVIEVADDGSGFDRSAIRDVAVQRGLLETGTSLSDDALLRLTLEPSLSTAQGVTQISGRGVGMDVVNTQVRDLGGTIQIASVPGAGTTITLRLPFTLSIDHAFLASVSGETFAIPSQFVEAVVQLSAGEVDALLAQEGGGKLEQEGVWYRFVPLASMLDLPTARPASGAVQIPIVLVRSGEHRVALLVEALTGRQAVVVKPLSRQLAVIGWYAGATILDDGKVVLVLDVPYLLSRERSTKVAVLPALTQGREDDTAVRTILVVDDSITVRRTMERFLSSDGMRVLTARDGLEALASLQDEVPDLVLLDIEMPRMDGLDVAESMRSDPRTEGVPVVMVTSRTGEEYRERARQLGVEEYLGKPHQHRELLRTINRLLSR